MGIFGGSSTGHQLEIASLQCPAPSPETPLVGTVMPPDLHPHAELIWEAHMKYSNSRQTRVSRKQRRELSAVSSPFSREESPAEKL